MVLLSLVLGDGVLTALGFLMSGPQKRNKVCFMCSILTFANYDVFFLLLLLFCMGGLAILCNILPIQQD